MAMFHGKIGKIVWNAEDGGSDVDISYITSWSISATADTTEITNMSSASDWKEFLASFKTWTATVEGNADSGGPEVKYETNESATANLEQGLGATWDDTDADPITKVFLELWFTKTAGDGLLYGPAIATDISHSVDMNDVGKVTYSFQGNGQILFKTAEPADFAEPLS